MLLTSDKVVLLNAVLSKEKTDCRTRHKTNKSAEQNLSEPIIEVPIQKLTIYLQDFSTPVMHASPAEAVGIETG